MAAASSSSSSSSSVVPIKEWTYDVYLSFSGEDTRHNFVDHLYTALTMQGIHVFKDEKYLRGDEPISEELVKAMKESRFAVAVFSKNYAYSSWCLDELSTIIECHKQMGGQKILPVYYHIDPLDVGKQKGEFATAFKKHEDEFRGEVDNVKKWRDALTAAYKIYGLHIFPGNMGESAFINKIVEVILADKQPRIDALYSKGGWKYDVYISFRGEDTRNNFVDHLYTALTMQGIHVFKEDVMIGVGKDISEFCAKAVKESRFAVVVFSKNYANSSWCLEELSLIMECGNQMGQKVLPVFYDIDPSDVRKQKREFKRAFEKHEDRFRGEVGKVKKWRDALTEAASLAGYERWSYRGESALITNIVENIFADKIRSVLQHVETSGRQIGKLILSDKVIGGGSSGTIVLEGSHDTRPVAVKRVLKSHHDVVSNEIQNLIDSDHLPNIVRYYGVEYDDDFIYIALERCICSLHELILSPTTVQSKLTLLEVECFKVRKPIGHPSPELLKVMRDTVAGLAHLHKLGFTHRNLKPQNVLICKDRSITAKVSDMGISKRLTNATGYGSSWGWQAPETLLHEPQTHAVDLFSLGCLLFFCITGGGHPFGDDIYDRDINIKKDLKDLSSLVDNIPEAFDLVSNLIHREPKSRPSAAEVYHHPLFWDPETRLLFFQDVSDRLKLEDRETGSDLLKALERIGTVALGGEWNKKLDTTLLNDIECYRKYKYDSLRDLLRVIRNKFNHYRELSEDVQAVLGPFPTGFEGYFRSRFPKLLMELYKVLKQYCGEEESLKKYYKKRGEAALTLRKRKIGKLIFSDKEIGKGSNGTIVREGMYDIRPVAVKRIVKVHHDDDAFKEIDHLLASDHHPNIVRYYDVEYDRDFVYIVLELCICSLDELILPPTNPTVRLQQLTLEERESFKVRKPIGYPSPELLKVMRDTVAGLAHLHKLRIIHRDLKPQNVLICKYSSISAKVSDMGISKRLPADKSSVTRATGYGSSGWQAPETLRKERQTIAVDLFSLGCLLFFCITGGGHPFGDDINHDRDTNVVKDHKDLSLVDNIPEAFDLVSNLIHPDPESRPSAAEGYHHPLFWKPDRRLSFLRDASDRVELEDRVPGSVLLTALEIIGTIAFGSQWDDKLDSTLLNDLNTGRHRKYTYTSVRDLLRVIRNKFNHYRELPKAVQIALGDVPIGFEGYFRSRFPKLLMEVYKVLKQYCGEEESLKKYFKKRVGRG